MYVFLFIHMCTYKHIYEYVCIYTDECIFIHIDYLLCVVRNMYIHMYTCVNYIYVCLPDLRYSAKIDWPNGSIGIVGFLNFPK